MRIFLFWFLIIFFGFLFSHAADSFIIDFKNSVGLAIVVIPVAVLLMFTQKWIFDVLKSAEGQRHVQNIQASFGYVYDLFGRLKVVMIGLIALFINVYFAWEISGSTSSESSGWAMFLFFYPCVIANFIFYFGVAHDAYQKRVTIFIKLMTLIITISIVALLIIGFRTPDYAKNKLNKSEVVVGKLAGDSRQYLFGKYNILYTYPANWNLVVIEGALVYITPERDENLLNAQLDQFSHQRTGLIIRSTRIKKDEIKKYLDNLVAGSPVGQSRKGDFSEYKGTLSVGGVAYPFFVSYAGQSISSSLYFFAYHDELFEAFCSIDLAKGITEEQCEKIITSIQFK